uniref:Ephexin-1-like n=1 Tax=Callorhinchus milii TaxID=7868 RepID=A0A4W3IEE0_CALMI
MWTKLSDAPSSSILQEPEMEHYEKDLPVRQLVTQTSSSRNSPLNVQNSQQSNVTKDAKPNETEAKIKYSPSSNSCSHLSKDEEFSSYSELEPITATESSTKAKRQRPALLPRNQPKSEHFSQLCLPSKPEENTQLMDTFAETTEDSYSGEREYMEINDNDVIYGHKLDTVPPAPKLPLPPLPSKPLSPCCENENRKNSILESSQDNRQASLTIRERNWTSRFANEPFYQAYNQASILKELKHQLSSRLMSQASRADPDSPNDNVVVRLPSQQKKKSDDDTVLQADDVRTSSPLLTPVKNKVKRKFSSSSTTSQAVDVRMYKEEAEKPAPSSCPGSSTDIRVDRDLPNTWNEARGEQGSSLPSEDVKKSRFSCWQEMPAVKESGALTALTRAEILLQESMFEVVTSEASYLRSLNVTIDHFMASGELSRLLTKQDKKILFSTITKIQQVSENFLIDLECRLDENPVISDICDITEHHAKHSFSSYIDYVRNQPYQEKIFLQFTKEKAQFTEVVNKLQEDPICHRLPLKSFLFLPFQRITRLKILVENILKRTEQGCNREKMAAAALKEVSKIVGECNKEVGKMKQTEEMVHIGNTIEFTKMKAIPVISQFRWLVKRGELLELSMQEKFFRLKKLSPVYLFLFNDLLLVTVQKGTEKARWMEALTQKKSSENDNEASEYEKVYEDWDCPQVQCLEAYAAQQADELSLEPANLINVTHKTTDGWYKGMRLSDGKMGWFPNNCVKEIMNEHVRRRNLLERYRVLRAAEELLQMKN